MIRPSDIHSITTFTRNAKKLIEKVNQDHSPMTITVNGEPQAIILDVETFQRLVDRSDHVRIAAAIDRAEQELADGKIKDADDVFDRLYAKYK